MRRPQRVHLNQNAVYYRGTGSIRFAATGAVITLSLAQEDLLEILLATPKIPVGWNALALDMAKSRDGIRHVVRGLRDALGTRAIRTHQGRGVSLQPQFIGTARFGLVHRIRAAQAPSARQA